VRRPRLSSNPVGVQLITGLHQLASQVHFRYADIGKSKMLRITVQEDGTAWRLHLAGRLAGAWVAEAENIWRSAPTSGRQVEIDMRELTGIDEAGRCLLQEMNQVGAHLVARGVEMEALVQEITRNPARGRA
jgi:hypothetical protein